MGKSGLETSLLLFLAHHAIPRPQKLLVQTRLSKLCHGGDGEPCEYPASRASFCLLDRRREEDRVKPLRSPGLANLVFSRHTGFFECEHLFIDKTMVITKPAEASARLSGLGSKLHPSNTPRMFNKDLTGFMQSLSH